MKPLIDPSIFKPKENIASPEEAYARAMDRALPHMARWLGICATCLEDLKLIEGRGWVCMHCEGPLSAAEIMGQGAQ